MIKKLLILLILLLMPLTAHSGTAYYVDCSLGTGSNNGTSPANAWKTLGAFAAATPLSSGDDVYFKNGTTCTLTSDSDLIHVNWAGTGEGDRAIIGCYTSAVDKTCDGDRPIIDGTRTHGTGAPNGTTCDGYPTNNNGRLIYSGTDNSGYDYQTIENLEVINSGGSAIALKSGDYPIIQNCKTSNNCRVGIGLYRTENGYIQDNEATDSYDWAGNGPCMEVSNTGEENAGSDNVIQRNKVYNCNEGIGAYQRAKNVIIQYNVVYDCGLGHIYSGAGKYITIRYNLVYKPSGCTYCGGKGIFYDNESARTYCYTGDNEIYGNLVANTNFGITVSNQYDYEKGGCDTDNTLIYNNTLVGNGENIRVTYDDSGWSGNEIKNNISVIKDYPTHVHYNASSPNGFTWSHNLFFTANTSWSPSGDAANNAVTGNPYLSKPSGWASIPEGTLDGTEFSLTASSNATGGAVLITNYNERITASDFTADPITVSKADQGDPDIGAWQYDSDPPAPSNFTFQGISVQGVTFD